MLMKYPIFLYQNLAIPHICSSEAAAQTLEFRAHAQKKRCSKTEQFWHFAAIGGYALKKLCLGQRTDTE